MIDNISKENLQNLKDKLKETNDYKLLLPGNNNILVTTNLINDESDEDSIVKLNSKNNSYLDVYASLLNDNSHIMIFNHNYYDETPNRLKCDAKRYYYDHDIRNYVLENNIDVIINLKMNYTINNKKLEIHQLNNSYNFYSFSDFAYKLYEYMNSILECNLIQGKSILPEEFLRLEYGFTNQVIMSNDKYYLGDLRYGELNRVNVFPNCIQININPNCNKKELLLTIKCLDKFIKNNKVDNNINVKQLKKTMYYL